MRSKTWLCNRILKISPNNGLLHAQSLREAPWRSLSLVVTQSRPFLAIGFLILPFQVIKSRREGFETLAALDASVGIFNGLS